MMDISETGVTPTINISREAVNGTTPDGEVDAMTQLFFILIYSLLFLVGLLLNGFTLKIYFCRTKQPSSSVTVYLKNLAAADFLISLCLPIRISHFASSSPPVLWVYCNFGASTFYLNMYASILFMGYIAANRYLKIIHPLGTHILQTVQAAHTISVLTWVFLLSTTTIYIITSLTTKKSELYVSNTLSCDSQHSKQLNLYYKVIHAFSILIFVLVLISLVFFYHSISLRLSQAQRRQPASSGSTKLAKSRRNMLVLVTVFCVCFVPYHLVRLPYVFLKRQGSLGQTLFILKELTIIVSALNVCLDPLIYFIFCKAFRAQFNLRKGSSSVQDATYGAKTERRSSDGRMSTVILNRRISLTTTTKPMSVL